MYFYPGNKIALALLAGAILSSIGCIAETPAGPIRTTMTAPNFQYIPAEKLRTTMWVLAAEIQHLDRLLSAPLEEEQKSMSIAVANSLERMRIAAKTLDEPGRSSQHPALTQNLTKFVDRLERAKRAANRNPPNFFPASTIAGSCFLCHGGKSVAGIPQNQVAATPERET